jgi:hypothetical protein
MLDGPMKIINPDIANKLNYFHIIYQIVESVNTLHKGIINIFNYCCSGVKPEQNNIVKMMGTRHKKGMAPQVILRGSGLRAWQESDRC